jgi:hypothetical protein
MSLTFEGVLTDIGLFIKQPYREPASGAATNTP